MKQVVHFSFILSIVLLFVIRAAFANGSQKIGLYLSFEERLAASVALSGYNQSEETRQKLVQSLTDYTYKLSQYPTSVVKVQNFNEFLRHYRGDWPSTHSLDLDLEIIFKRNPRPLPRYEAGSPRVQRQIDAYLGWKRKYILGTAGLGLQGLLSSDKSERDFAAVDLTKLIDGQMKKLDQVGDHLANEAFKHVPDKAIQISMEVVLQEYFSRLAVSSKKLILSSFLGEDLLMDQMKRFELMVQNSGPQFQKLLQIMAREKGLPEDLEKIFRVLEDAVRPVPWIQVKEIVQQEKQNFDFTYFERKPLGVGTMAQVHRAQMYDGDKRVNLVARFIKPGIPERVDEDAKILAEVAVILDNRPDYRETGAPPISPIVKDLAATVFAELDIVATESRQREGRIAYSQRSLIQDGVYKNYLDISVPELIHGKERTSSLMVQEMIFGKKIDKEVQLVKDLAPNLKRVVTEEIAKIWIDEAFYKGGFYHSDLHQGNILVQVLEQSIRLNILDFGMGGRLSPGLQTKIILLGLGAKSEDSAMLAQVFAGLNEELSGPSRDDLQKQISERILERKANGEPILDLGKWIGWALERGIKLPYDLINLKRGFLILDKLLAEAGSKETMSTIAKKLALRHPLRTAQKLMKYEKVPTGKILKLGINKVLSTLKSAVGAPAPLCRSIFVGS